MAKKEDNKGERKTKLDLAKEDLQKKQAAYEALIKQRPTDHKSHQKACRKALAEKRYARIVVECISTGRDVPDAAEMPETKAAVEGQD